MQQYFRILGGKLIQLSDSYIEGYQPIVEDVKPEEKEGFYISYNYIIENGIVRKVYEYKEIIEEENEVEA